MPDAIAQRFAEVRQSLFGEHSQAEELGVEVGDLAVVRLKPRVLLVRTKTMPV